MKDIKPDKFYIFSNSGGCPQNQLDGGRIVTYLLGNGYVQSVKPDNCGIIIVNSCAYCKLKENQSFNKVFEYLTAERRVILTGCLPKVAPVLLEGIPEEVAVIPGCEPDRFEDIFPPLRITWKQVHINYIPRSLFLYTKRFRRTLFLALSSIRKVFPLKIVHHLERLLMFDHTPDSFIVEICKGCAGNCAYCAIRISRGALRSRPEYEILEEIRAGIDKGVKEIMLTGTETSAYGIDIGTSLASLLQSIVKLLTDQKLIIFYANPRWLIKDWPKLEPVFATGKIHFIHISLNGCSNNILKSMNRGFTLDEFEKLVVSIKSVSPGTILQSQVITGFPGETEVDFSTVCDFFRRIYIHNVQVHAFDPRPGTAAAVMANQVSPEVAQRRRWQLYRLTLRRKIVYDIKYILKGFRYS